MCPSVRSAGPLAEISDKPTCHQHPLNICGRPQRPVPAASSPSPSASATTQWRWRRRSKTTAPMCRPNSTKCAASVWQWSTTQTPIGCPSSGDANRIIRRPTLTSRISMRRPRRRRLREVWSSGTTTIRWRCPKTSTGQRKVVWITVIIHRTTRTTWTMRTTNRDWIYCIGFTLFWILRWVF